MRWAIPFIVCMGLWAKASIPPPPDPPPGHPPVPPAWATGVTNHVTNTVLQAKDTFKVSLPMQTCTNLVEGAWTNEQVEILIGIETNVPTKFFKLQEAE